VADSVEQSDESGDHQQEGPEHPHGLQFGGGRGEEPARTADAAHDGTDHNPCDVDGQHQHQSDREEHHHEDPQTLNSAVLSLLPVVPAPLSIQQGLALAPVVSFVPVR
jgi:hypothetical protein